MKKMRLFTIVILVTMPVFVLFTKDTMGGGNDTLQIIYKKLDLKSEGNYLSIMSDRKHSADRLAPEILRFFVENFEPQRLSFSQGISYENGNVIFWWYIDEFAVKGDAGSFHMMADLFFKEHEYITQRSLAGGNDKYTYIFNDNTNDLIYTFTLEQFVNYSGGPLSGGSVSLRILYNRPIAPPETQQVLKIYPSLNCAYLPSKVLDVLKKLNFSTLFYGGTWEQYYTWNIDIPCASDDELKVLRKKLIDAALSEGFAFKETSDNTVVYNNSDDGTGSYLYITSEEGSVLNFRFQPNS